MQLKMDLSYFKKYSVRSDLGGGMWDASSLEIP